MDRKLGTMHAAKALGVSEPTVRKFADMGHLPVERTLSSHRIFTASDVRRFAKERSQKRS